MAEIDKKLMNDEIYMENKAEEIGLLNLWAYHCYRCNYTWLPKDFDFNRRLKDDENYNYGWGHDLFYREPPKCCARCKSKSWNKEVPLLVLLERHWDQRYQQLLN